MDDVRIQVVNYKTKAYLLECLKSLEKDLKETSLSYTVAIVDNASGENLNDIPERFSSFQRIETYHNTENRGFGAGHNFLAKREKARWLLFLNPNIKIIEEKTVERLIALAEKRQVQVLGPRLITADGQIQKWDHGELLPRLFLCFAINSWKERKESAPVAWVSGAVFLIEQEAFSSIGGFDEHFFLYAEELDLCLRIRAQGGKIIYDPSITVFHHCGVVAKKWMHLPRSIIYFIWKHSVMRKIKFVT